jgi:hypothetical protein
MRMAAHALRQTLRHAVIYILAPIAINMALGVPSSFGLASAFIPISLRASAKAEAMGPSSAALSTSKDILIPEIPMMATTPVLVLREAHGVR